MLIDRVKELVSIKGISARKFAENIGFNYTTLNNYFNGTRNTIDSTLLEKIISTYDDVNSEWLLSGVGNPLKGTRTNVQILHQSKCTEILDDQEVILYDVNAAANLKTLFDNKSQNILGKISIPNIPKCDGALFINGDSMYPLLKSGDIVGYKELNNFQHVIYGEMYLISFEQEGDEFLTVKYVNRSEIKDHIKLVSYNSHHCDMDIPISTINAIALIKFSVRKNTMI